MCQIISVLIHRDTNLVKMGLFPENDPSDNVCHMYEVTSVHVRVHVFKF